MSGIGLGIGKGLGVTYRFRVRVGLTVRANFYVHFADGVFDISIFGKRRRVQIAPGKKFAVTSGLRSHYGQLDTDF